MRELIPNLIFSLSSLWFVHLGEPDVLKSQLPLGNLPFGQSTLRTQTNKIARARARARAVNA